MPSSFILASQSFTPSILGVMSWCGAFDKTLASRYFHRSLLRSRSRFLPLLSVAMPRARKRASTMSSQHLLNVPSNSKSQTADMKSQGGAADTSRPGWRPYNGRWNAKMAYRDSRHEGAPKNNQMSRQSRPQRDQSMVGSYSNQVTDFSNYQAARSISSRGDPPSLQPSHSQNAPDSLPASNVQAEFPMMDPRATFDSFPSFDPSASQMPFVPPNMSEQSHQPQFLRSFDQSFPNPPFFPFWTGGNPFMGIQPFLPPAAFLGLDMQSLIPSNPMLNATDPLGANSPANLTAVGPSGSAQPPSAVNTQRQAKARKPPSVAKKYIDQSSLPPQRSVTPRSLLVILDLNGTLIYRKTRKFPPSFQRRAGLDDFLKALVQKYKVMIWSSSTPATVDAVCQKIFSGVDRKKLVAEWGRDRLNLSKSEYNSKIQVYKTLETVWSSKEVQDSYPKKGAAKAKKQTSRWDQTNTILIDDSKLKALSEPYNLIEIPEFTNAPGIDESTIFPRVLERLEILATCDDVSKMLCQWTTTAPETTILDLDLTPFHSSPESQSQTRIDPNLEPVEARKPNRKARKLEKRAARRATAALAAKASASPPQKQSAFPSSIMSVKANTEPKQSHTQAANSSSIPGKQRSPSPVLSVQSENSLLDRLERSLNS
ncbi:NLI interacting factor-like phosphatase-domain-containing protein [Aspergillus spectabilis]